MTQQEEQNLLSSWERSRGEMGNVGGGRRLEGGGRWLTTIDPDH